MTSVCRGIPSCRSPSFPFSGLTPPQPEAVESLCHVLCQNSDRWLAPQEAFYPPAHSAVYSWANVDNKTRGSWGACLNLRAMLGSFNLAMAGWPTVCQSPTLSHIEIRLIDHGIVYHFKGPSQTLCWFFSSVIYRCISTSVAIYHGWSGILEFGSGQQALAGRIVDLESNPMVRYLANNSGYSPSL